MSQKRLWDACSHGNIVALRKALKKRGVDLARADEQGCFALLIAALDGQLAVCKILIANGANVKQ